MNTDRKIHLPEITQEFTMPSYQFIVNKGENALDVQKNLIDQEDMLPVDFYDAENQTDELIPRPFLPYIPAKIGVDTGTQVEDHEMHLLFNFDEEVKPLLEVLVTKTIEQAVFELERESELLNIYYQTLQYQKDQDLEREKLKALEHQLIEDKRRAQLELEEKRQVVNDEKKLMLKMGCYLFASQIVSPMPDTIADDLLELEWKHFITDSAEDFLKVVYEDVRTRMQRWEESKALIEGKALSQTIFLTYCNPDILNSIAGVHN